MTASELALSRATLAVLANAETQEGSPYVETWRNLITGLGEDEAGRLPAAIASVLDALRSDPDRLGLTLDIAVTFDLVELLPKMVELAAEGRAGHVLLRAALLANNPAAPPGVKK